MSEEKDTRAQHSEPINIKDILFQCLGKWYWFVISLAICMGIAVWYILTTPPVYVRSASLLIKENQRNRSSIDNQFAELGIFNTNTNVLNEIRTLSSPDLMSSVVKRLGLEYNYTVDGRFHKQTLYGNTLPVTVVGDGIPDQTVFKFTLQVGKDGKIELSNFEQPESDFRGQKVSGSLNDTIVTPVGKLIVQPNPAYTPTNTDDYKEIFVSKSSLQGAIAKYVGALSVTQQEEKSNVIDLSIRDVSPQRAANVLSTLIVVYNENWVQDKNQIAVSTSMFIADRLGVIENELGNVDSDISAFKSENLVPDVNAVATMAMQRMDQAEASIQELNNQVYMARYARNYLANSANNNQVLPVATGVANMNISSQIGEYNNQLMERNSLVANSSEKNPLVSEMDANLAQLRSALISSIDNEIVSLNAQISSQRGTAGQAVSQIARNPQQSKYLLSVERQQKVKESLYLYLLQKREENELSQAFTAYNTRVITRPNGSSAPVAPRKAQILLIAFVVGMALPIGLVYLREILNSTVRGRKDLENMTIPLVGELPLADKRSTITSRLFDKLKGKKADEQKEGVVLVKEKSRNVINEAFRVVRTNLEFMTSDEKTPVIAITSANPGSGKTFITFNLALSLAIKQKKVLVIDLDLRKGSLSKYIGSPKEGISNYLAGQCSHSDSIIYQSKENANLDVIPIGMIPPNPTELLFNERLAQLVADMRTDYDYIFLDCPPLEIVADAAIINKLCDMTIFIVRAGLLERSMLPEIERFYKEKKYKNIKMLLNGTEVGGSKYSSRYGSRYGYHYGYHYGYGSYAVEE